MRQLGRQNRSLNRVHPFGQTYLVIFILAGAAVISQFPDSRQERIVVTGDCACIAVGSEILSRIKAEAREIANASTSTTIVLGAVSLRRVFDQWQLVATRDLRQLLHFRRLPVEVNREYRSGPRRYCCLNEAGIEIVRVRIDIDENGFRSDVRDRTGGSDESVCGCNYFITGPDAQRKECQVHCRGARSHGDGAFGPDKGSEGLFEVRNLLPQNETGTFNDALDGSIDFRLDAGVLCPQIYQRYLNRITLFF
jgi:hypothetical protein